MVAEIEREFQTLLSGPSTDLLPEDVKPEVLERVLAVATELAVEGREGRPVGCLFVVGDTAKVEEFTKPLVLNPFFGYKEEDRNILNPFMDETVKEFSSIDGAFVIRGDGVVEAAGSLVQATGNAVTLPERARQPARGGRGHQRRGELHLDRGVVEHGPGHALPARGDAPPDGEAPLGPPPPEVWGCAPAPARSC